MENLIFCAVHISIEEEAIKTKQQTNSRQVLKVDLMLKYVEIILAI